MYQPDTSNFSAVYLDDKRYSSISKDMQVIDSTQAVIKQHFVYINSWFLLMKKALEESKENREIRQESTHKIR